MNTTYTIPLQQFIFCRNCTGHITETPDGWKHTTGGSVWCFTRGGNVADPDPTKLQALRDKQRGE